MGLFITVNIPEGLTTKDGDVIKTFQTKSINGYYTVYLIEGRLYEPGDKDGMFDAPAYRDPALQIDCDGLLEIRTIRYVASKLSCKLLVYASNRNQKVRVLKSKTYSMYGEQLEVHHPEVAYDLNFHDGRLVSAEHSKASETVAEVRAKLVKQGLRIIDDGDPLLEILETEKDDE